jgi:hypothetical protein
MVFQEKVSVRENIMLFSGISLIESPKDRLRSAFFSASLQPLLL